MVGYAAGGGTDALARMVGTQLSTQMGQPVLIENRPGGATVIAADATAKSPADGYTIMSADGGTLVFNTALFKKLSYQPTRDFAPVALLGRFPLLLAVSATSGYSDVRQLIDEMKREPGKLSYGSPGVGGPHHLAMEMLKERNQLDVVHAPYRGAAPAIQDLLGGQIPLMVVDTVAAMPMIKAGKIRALATFGKARLATLPNVPSLMELGYADIEIVPWQGIVVPAATPKDVIDRLSTELRKAVMHPSVNSRLLELGLLPTPADTAAMQLQWKQDAEFWPQLIRQKGISAE
jgi:tripartite-type tricarboxylate transporter receptor subunit TctC